jgi:hypothetical protein
MWTSTLASGWYNIDPSRRNIVAPKKRYFIIFLDFDFFGLWGTTCAPELEGWISFPVLLMASMLVSDRGSGGKILTLFFALKSADVEFDFKEDLGEVGTWSGLSENSSSSERTSLLSLRVDFVGVLFLPMMPPPTFRNKVPTLFNSHTQG